MPYGYPATLAECIEPSRKYKPAVLKAVQLFAKSKPYQGTIEEKQAKYRAMHIDLCAAYGIDVELRFGTDWGKQEIPSFRSFCSHRESGRIIVTLYGRSSVVTYLHEFAHAIGKDEYGAVKWSVNLFARKFPRSFERTVASDHLVVTPGTEAESAGAAATATPDVSMATFQRRWPAVLQRRVPRRRAECPDDTGEGC